MRLVKERSSLASVISQSFVAVTFHELFKEAALDGNRKMKFGLQWQQLLRTLQVGFDGADLAQKIADGAVKEIFDEMDQDGSGSLTVDELLVVLQKLGGERVSRGSVANLVRLADEDGSGTIEYGEFENTMKRLTGSV